MTIPFITGTVSHGTLRPEDLIPAFARLHHAMHGDPALTIEAERAHLLSPEDQDELVVTLMDAIDALLPEGWYFGTLEGDGSDFGVWEVEAE